MNGKLTPTLDWDVRELYFSPIPDHPTMFKVVSRSDNNDVLGIFSTQYNSFSNADLIYLCRKLEETGLFTIEGFTTFNNGKKVVGYLRNNSKILQVSGKQLKNLLIIGNSHDGSSKLFIGSSYTMLNCANQFSTILRFWEKKHLQCKKDEKINIKELTEIFIDAQDVMVNTMKRWGDTMIDYAEIEAMVAYLLPLQVSKLKTHSNCLNSTILLRQEMLKAIAIETDALGPSFWSVFNGVIYFTAQFWKSELITIGNFHNRQEKLQQLAWTYLEKLYTNNEVMNR